MAARETVFLREVVAAYDDWIPYSLFHVLQLQDHLAGSKRHPREFYVEALKPEFIANVDAIRKLLKEYINESDSELAGPYILNANEWFALYLNVFDVDPQEIDVQKTAYFFGHSFMQYLKYVGSQGLYADSIKEYRQTAGLMMLNVLNRMLEQDIGTRLSDDMFLKLCEAVMQEKELEYLGHFGIYMIFKNCSKLIALRRSRKRLPKDSRRK